MEIEIYWRDLTEEKQVEIATQYCWDIDKLESFEKEMNWDTFPIFILESTNG